MTCRAHDAMMGWLDHRYHGQEIVAVTYVNYRCHIDDFVAHVGDIPINQIDIHDIEKWKANTRRNDGAKLKPKSLKARTDVIKAFFRWAYETRLIDHNPARTLRPVRVPKTLPKSLDEDSIQRVLWVSDLRTRTIILLAWKLGLRRGEIAELDATDWDRRNQTIHITGKGAKDRVLNVHGVVERALAQWVETLDGSKPAMFPSNYSSHGRTNANTIGSWVSKAGKTAGVAGVHTHLFRHTRGTEMRRAGIDESTVAATFGHEDLNTTHIYTRAAATDVRQAAMRMADLERSTGIGPALSDWKSEVLPLNYDRRGTANVPLPRPRSQRCRYAS